MEGYGFGSGDEVATDKADSQAQPAQKIIQYGSKEIRFLLALKTIALIYDHPTIVTLVESMMDMTDQQKNAMSREELQAQLNQAFDAVQDAMSVWLNKHFVDVLTLIQNSQ